MDDCKAYATPYQLGVKLMKYCESPQVDATLYHWLVIILIYLTHSQLYISFVVTMVSYLIWDLREIHWKDGKHTNYYIKDTSHLVSNTVDALTHWLATPSLIGMAMVMIGNQLFILCSTIVMVLWYSIIRNKRLSLYQPLNMSSMVLSMLAQRFFGFDSSWVGSSFLSKTQLFFIVAIKI